MANAQFDSGGGRSPIQTAARKRITANLFQQKKTPFYIASRSNKNTAPMSQSSSAIKAANTANMVDRNAGRDAAQAVPKTATQAAQKSTAASRAAVTISGGAAPSSGSSGSTYKAPTPGSGSTSTSTSTNSTATSPAPTSAPAPKPTTSSGTSVAVGQPNLSNAGKGRGAMRGNRKSRRDNPRAARSTSIDELKKQAAKRLGI